MDKVFGALFGGLMGELKMHPWTTLTAVAALVMVLYQGTTHARAADVQSIAEQIADIRAAQVEDKIVTARFRYCHAVEDVQRAYFAALVREYQEQYRKLTGRIYVLPTCVEV